MAGLHRCADGRLLCNPHNKSGAPRYHTEGCWRCEEARDKGIIRPDADQFTRGQRCSSGYHGMRSISQKQVAKNRMAKAKHGGL